MLSCELHCVSSTDHLDQLYTGFGQLARKGLVQLDVRRAPGYSSRRYSIPVLHVDVRGDVVPNGRLRLTFDMEDHADLPAEGTLEDTQVLFKRSYEPTVVSAAQISARVLPVGLNYGVVDHTAFGMRRALWARHPSDFVRLFVRNTRWLARTLGVQGSIFACEPRRFEGMPRLDPSPKVLFMARVWDPDRKPAFKADRQEINAMRAECVRHLRKAFPGQFWGGLTRDEYSERHYPDCVIPYELDSHKPAYLDLMHRSSICVATTGLRGSIGWKFAEYVAGAKAIVSEPTTIKVPGVFGSPTNYLSFRTPQGCVESVGTLLDSRSRRIEMMRANAAYYHGFMRPDVLVWNALTSAILAVSPAASASEFRRHVIRAAH